MKAHCDLELAQFAAGSYGVFTRAQAREWGFSARMIQRRVEMGWWIAIYPNVYCFAATPPSWHRDQVAACHWADGPAAGLAAGFLFELPDCDDPPVEVMTHKKHRSMPIDGVIVRVTNRLPTDQITTRHGIPTTSIERTLMSLCAQLRPYRAAMALDNALFRGLTTTGNIDHLLYRTARQGRNGCRILRDLIKRRSDSDEVPNSPLETVIYDLIVRSGLDLPQLQHPIYDTEGNFVGRPDFVYPDQRVIIEGHSKLWHSGRAAEENDRRRHERFVDLGYKVIYLGWSDATRYGTQTVDRLGKLMDERVLVRSERAVGGGC